MLRFLKHSFSDLHSWQTFLGLVAALVLAVVPVAQGGPEKPGGPPPAPVQAASVVEDTVSEQIALVGTTEPVARTTVAAEVSGLVEAYPIREGDFVKQGQVLTKLRSTDLALRLRAAEATKAKVESNLGFAEKELARYEKLNQSDSVAVRKYDEVVNEHESLRQERIRIDSEIALLKDDIEKTNIRAPFSGFVAQEHTQVGQWLTVGGTTATVLDLSQVRITVDVPERYVVHMAPESPARVVVASLSGEPVNGKVSAILPEGDPNARTFPVRVTLPNPGFRIRSGMEARVTFALGTTKKALLVPKDAIVSSGGNRMVYVVVGGTAQPVPVEVTGYYDGQVAVQGPLKPGDQVVIRGNERLRPGQPVSVIQ